MQIKELTIEGAWRMALWQCAKEGYKYKVKKGSYEGQLRKQLPFLTVIIEEPWQRPLAPSMPEGTGIPAPTNEERIHNYFYEYLATNTKTDQEDYTYGEFIEPQLDRAIKLLNESNGGTNQATLNIGGEQNIFLSDPPCLRVVDFKVVDGQLMLSVFFRSWDLFAGFPENIGGLQLLKEYVLMHLEFPVEDGHIVAYSSGAHVYEQYFPVVDVLSMHKC